MHVWECIAAPSSLAFWSYFKFQVLLTRNDLQLHSPFPLLSRSPFGPIRFVLFHMSAQSVMNPFIKFLFTTPILFLISQRSLLAINCLSTASQWPSSICSADDRKDLSQAGRERQTSWSLKSRTEKHKVERGEPTRSKERWIRLENLQWNFNSKHPGTAEESTGS